MATVEELLEELERVRLEKADLEQKLQEERESHKKEGKQAVRVGDTAAAAGPSGGGNPAINGSTATATIAGPASNSSAAAAANQGIRLTGFTTRQGNDATNGHFVDTTFHDCTMNNVTFQNCKFTNVHFVISTLENYLFFNVVLENVRFELADFQNGAWSDDKIVSERLIDHPLKEFTGLMQGGGVPDEISDPAWLSLERQLADGTATWRDAEIAAKLQEEEYQQNQLEYDTDASGSSTSEEPRRHPDSEHETSTLAASNKSIVKKWNDFAQSSSKLGNWSPSDGNWSAQTPSSKKENFAAGRNHWNDVSYTDKEACQTAYENSWGEILAAPKKTEKDPPKGSSPESDRMDSLVDLSRKWPKIRKPADETPHFKLGVQKRRELSAANMEKLNNFRRPTYGIPMAQLLSNEVTAAKYEVKMLSEAELFTHTAVKTTTPSTGALSTPRSITPSPITLSSGSGSGWKSSTQPFIVETEEKLIDI